MSEYEVELIVRKYQEPEPYNRLSMPDEVEVFYGRKVLNPGSDSLDDYLDEWKSKASDAVVADVLSEHDPTPAETYYEAYGQ